MILDKSKLKVGSDFSGVGAFNQALIRLGVEYDEIFACDMDKYARQTFVNNYGEPKYYPENVYDREIPKDSLDIYMTSPPCQPFSLAGKRKGEDDKRGVLFYNSTEFIRVNKPKPFIFENVAGLLSHDKGKTFGRWIDLLGGITVNNQNVFAPNPEAVPYRIYYKLINAKKFNIPQNRDRIFIVGIRADFEKEFNFPKEIPLVKRLKDILEPIVDEKYFLSDNFINYCYQHKELHKSKGNGFSFEPKDINDIAGAITTKYGSRQTDAYVKIKSANAKGYELAKIGEDSISLGYPNSKTSRGRVGKNYVQTLTTTCNQGVVIFTNQSLHKNPNVFIVEKKSKVIFFAKNYDFPKIKFQLNGGKWDTAHEQSRRVYDINGIAPTIHTMQGGYQEPKISMNYRIRKLTPRECFRAMDYPDSFKFSVSDTQAYKQAGNSICIEPLARIIKNIIKCL